jgi:FSR family fosmidomycin resistance protein-like MFS transporter
MNLFRRMSEFSEAEHNILLITCPGHFFTHFFTLTFPAITIPLTTAFGMPLEQVLKLSFWMYLLYGALAIPVGLAADRWRAKPMMTAGIALMGAGLVIAGAVPSPRVMTLALAAVGVGASVYHPAGIALISHTVRLRGLALGVNGVFGSLGIAMAPLLTGLLTWAFGWQVALVSLGMVGLVTAAVVHRVRVDETIRPHAAREFSAGQGLVPLMVLLCVALVLGGIAYRGNMLLLPAYMELKTTFLARVLENLPFAASRSTTTLAASILASLVFFAGLLGQVVGGRAADRMELRRAYLLFHALSFPFLFAMAFTSEAALVVCAILYGLFSFGMQPVENSLIAAITPARWRSTSFAVKFALNFGVGSSVVQIIAPIKTRYSLEMVYVFLGTVVFLLALCALFMILVSRRVPPIRN